MATILKEEKKILSIIIPTFNEEETLPLLLNDLKSWRNNQLEITIVDGGSNDNTLLVCDFYGANVIKTKVANRGAQLQIGANNSNGEWLLFLHADSRLKENWSERIYKIIRSESSFNKAWFFNLKINSPKISFRLLEFLVNLRSKFLKKPYGDQGLLIHKESYKKIGGYKPLQLMEDLDLIIRLSKEIDIKSLNISILTSSRKWRSSNIFIQGIRNSILKYKWRKGISSNELHKEYYKE